MFLCFSIQFSIRTLYSLRRPQDGACWEMFKRGGVVLKGGVQIGLGWVPGIACFCKEAEVGEFQPFDQFCLPIEERKISAFPIEGMNEKETEEK